MTHCTVAAMKGAMTVLSFRRQTVSWGENLPPFFWGGHNAAVVAGHRLTFSSRTHLTEGSATIETSSREWELDSQCLIGDTCPRLNPSTVAGGKAREGQACRARFWSPDLSRYGSGRATCTRDETL